ncbi:hypothetical protein [Nocardia tengchongensis]|uniref:hypothetical protein n=1 Tax=Nocardia tengchongensis TaxID=2055889 RepID=UPI00360D3737
MTIRGRSWSIDTELLNLAARLRESHTLAQFRDIRAGVEAVAELVAALESEQVAYEVIRRLYLYLDVTSAE